MIIIPPSVLSNHAFIHLIQDLDLDHYLGPGHGPYQCPCQGPGPEPEPELGPDLDQYQGTDQGLGQGQDLEEEREKEEIILVHFREIELEIYRVSDQHPHSLVKNRLITPTLAIMIILIVIITKTSSTIIKITTLIQQQPLVMPIVIVEFQSLIIIHRPPQYCHPYHHLFKINRMNHKN